MKRFFHLLPLFAVVLKVSGATFTVTSANDSGTGSLRQAILDANSSSDRDTIEFNIPARPGFVIVPTIKPLSPLPTITQPVTIDGTTQPAGKVALDGSSAGATPSANVLLARTLVAEWLKATAAMASLFPIRRPITLAGRRSLYGQASQACRP